MRVVHIPVDPVQLDLYRIKAAYRRKLLELKEKNGMDWIQRRADASERYRQKRLLLKEKHGTERVPRLAIPLWRTLKGRGTLGERALVFAREHYRKKGYKVWSSGSGGRPDSFMLVSFPGLRAMCHPGYRRMLKKFDPRAVLRLNQAAERAKKHLPGNLGGGDPDLFVFKNRKGKQVRFFVEAKHKDKLSKKQKQCFELIEKHLNCEVVIAQITEKKKPRRAE